ncbi:MAG: hypothetical protein AAFW84_17415 [Cyanobacteria bacterium J06635_15]
MSRPRPGNAHPGTVRLVLLLGVVGALVLFTIQNSSPGLPLTVLGVRTQTYPLAVWLTGSILAGALTTLLLTWIVAPLSYKKVRRGQQRGDWGRDRPRPPTGDDSRTNRQSSANSTGFADFDSRDVGRNIGREPNRTVADTRPDINAQDWGNFRPRETWNDWEQSPDPDSPTPASVRDQRRDEKERQKKRKDPRYAANESFEDIAQGWDNWDDRNYQPRGASPIDDTLADIEEGWEDYGDDYGVYQDDYGAAAPQSDRIDDGPQPQKRIYQDGSIYGDRYEDEPFPRDAQRPVSNYRSGEVDWDRPNRDYPDPDYPNDTDDYPNPGDDRDYESDRDYEDDYAYDNTGADADDRDIADDDVYDADYRVIIPPYRPLADEDDDTDDIDDRDRP